MTSLFGVFQNLSADEKVVVTDIKGEKISFLLSTNPIVSFDAYSLILNTNEETVSYPLTEYRSFTIESNPSSVKQTTLLQSPLFFINNGLLEASGLKPKSKILVCNISGMVITEGITDENGYISLSLGTAIKFGSEIQPTELQDKLTGTYVELFSEQGTLAAKWDSLWIAECTKYVGEENADSSAKMLKYSMLGTLTGAEATAKFGDGSNGFASDIQFSCHFLNSVARFVFDGCTIKGLATDSTEIFAHNYVKVGYNAEHNFHIYKSTDNNDDEFKYFFICPDNPKDTYHIEFRYGSDEKELPDFFTGKYAYWMAAGVLENNDKQCEKLYGGNRR